MPAKDRKQRDAQSTPDRQPDEAPIRRPQRRKPRQPNRAPVRRPERNKGTDRRDGN
jgi:hypothetical protein